MIIFDFITQEEIDELPDDDPREAFTKFVRIAQRRLAENTAQLDGDKDWEWRAIQEARHGFMNVVIAAAKKFEIEPFASIDVPRLSDFDDAAHRQFKADLDHYLTQLLLDNSARARRDSVHIPPDLKASIRSYLHHLREAIDKADLGDAKREVLLRKLADFESELDKKRLSLVSVAMFSIAILSAPGGIGATTEIANKLVTNILLAVGEAKSADDETRRLPPSTAPMAITGPRKHDAKPTRKARESFTADLDEEIPF